MSACPCQTTSIYQSRVVLLSHTDSKTVLHSPVSHSFITYVTAWLRLRVQQEAVHKKCYFSYIAAVTVTHRLAGQDRVIVSSTQPKVVN